MSTAIVDIPHAEISEKNWLRVRIEDVRKITSAAAKLRIHRRKKDEKKQQQQQQQKELEEQKRVPDVVATHAETSDKSTSKISTSTPALPSKPTVSSATTKSEKKWTLSDSLRCLGIYVQRHCTHLSTIPSASEVATWVRYADRALQLNGWTVNSFLLESHVVFTYMLLSRAFTSFRVAHLADVKELVLMCLYISYTYNANEISYPLRPFLVKHDRAAFWDKCTTLSLSASKYMLRINQDRVYYEQLLACLKSNTLE